MDYQTYLKESTRRKERIIAMRKKDPIKWTWRKIGDSYGITPQRAHAIGKQIRKQKGKKWPIQVWIHNASTLDWWFHKAQINAGGAYHVLIVGCMVQKLVTGEQRKTSGAEWYSLKLSGGKSSWKTLGNENRCKAHGVRAQGDPHLGERR